MSKKTVVHKFIWKRFEVDDIWSPSHPWIARVIGGLMTHIGATTSQLDIRKTGTVIGEQIYLCVIPSITCSESFGINPITVTSDYTEEYTTDSTKIWFGYKDNLRFTGGTNARANVLIELVKIDEYTGEHLA